jgi:hypothetical protein
MKKSAFLSLDAKDAVKGFVVAALTSIGMAIVPVLQAGGLPTLAQLKVAGIAGLAAGISYLVKNLFTNSKDEIGKPEAAKQ